MENQNYSSQQELLHCPNLKDNDFDSTRTMIDLKGTEFNQYFILFYYEYNM